MLSTYDLLKESLHTSLSDCIAKNRHVERSLEPANLAPDTLDLLFLLVHHHQHQTADNTKGLGHPNQPDSFHPLVKDFKLDKCIDQDCNENPGKAEQRCCKEHMRSKLSWVNQGF